MQGALELRQRLADYPIKLTRDLSEARMGEKPSKGVRSVLALLHHLMQFDLSLLAEFEGSY